MPEQKTLLEKLEAKQKKLNDEIKEAKKKEAQRLAATNSQRCEIIGAAIVAELKDNEALGEQLNPIIERRVKSAKARKLLGLPPLPKK